MGTHFMRLLSIYVLNFNVKYIYLVSCLVEINLCNLYKILNGRLHTKSLKISTKSNTVN